MLVPIESAYVTSSNPLADLEGGRAGSAPPPWATDQRTPSLTVSVRRPKGVPLLSLIHTGDCSHRNYRPNSITWIYCGFLQQLDIHLNHSRRRLAIESR